MNDARDEPHQRRRRSRAAATRRGTRRGSTAREKPSARSVPISAGARRHARVHRDHRADDGADREDDRDRGAEVGDELGERLRLVRVELRARASPRAVRRGSALDPALDRVELAGVGRAGRSSAEKPTRRNACSSCSASPQISELKPVRPASNTPTTVQSRCAKRSVSPIAGAAESLRDRAARDDLRRAGPEHAPFDDAHLRPQRQAFGRRRRESRRWTGLPVSRLGRLMSTTGSFDMSLRPSSPVAISGNVSTIAAEAAVDAALHFGLRAAADHDHVVRLAGGDERLLRVRRPASARSRTRRRRAPCRPPSAPW